MKKVKLTVDLPTGNIIEAEKPFFPLPTWKKILINVGKLITNMQDNFDNDRIITQKFIEGVGFPGLAKKLQKK